MNDWQAPGARVAGGTGRGPDIKATRADPPVTVNDGETLLAVSEPVLVMVNMIWAQLPVSAFVGMDPQVEFRMANGAAVTVMGPTEPPADTALLVTSSIPVTVMENQALAVPEPE